MSPETEAKVRILLTPILALLKSRKFVAAVAAILVSILIAKAPDLAPYADMLILGIMLVAAVLTGSIAHEDAAARKAEATEAAAKTQAENLQTAIEEAIRTFYAEQQSNMALVTATAETLDFPVMPSAQEVADLVTASLVERERLAPKDGSG